MAITCTSTSCSTGRATATASVSEAIAADQSRITGVANPRCCVSMQASAIRREAGRSQAECIRASFIRASSLSPTWRAAPRTSSPAKTRTARATNGLRRRKARSNGFNSFAANAVCLQLHARLAVSAISCARWRRRSRSGLVDDDPERGLIKIVTDFGVPEHHGDGSALPMLVQSGTLPSESDRPIRHPPRHRDRGGCCCRHHRRHLASNRSSALQHSGLRVGLRILPLQ
jgi:hypothetical protein